MQFRYSDITKIFKYFPDFIAGICLSNELYYLFRNCYLPITHYSCLLVTLYSLSFKFNITFSGK